MPILTQSQYDNIRIRVMQLEDDRPARMLCPISNDLITVFRAYEALKAEREEEQKP